MKLALDVDGVLANFFSAYEAEHIRVTGKDLFGENKWPNKLPQEWNWPATVGYTAEETSAVWNVIKTQPRWSYELTPLEDAWQYIHLAELVADELFFISSRVGINIQSQTWNWLHDKLNVKEPNVIIASNKGEICRALGINLIFDDKGENCLNILTESPLTTTVCLQYPYNREFQDEILAHGGILIDGPEKFASVLKAYKRN